MIARCVKRIVDADAQFRCQNNEAGQTSSVAVKPMKQVLYLLAVVGIWLAANLTAQELYPTSRRDDYVKRVVYRLICIAMFFVVCGVLSLIWWAFTGRF